MNKKVYVIQLLYGILFALYLKHCYESPFIFLAGKEGGFGLLEIVRWITLFLPVWAVVCFQYEEAWMKKKLVVHRYRSPLKWWSHLQLQVIGSVGIAYLAFFFTLSLTLKFHITENEGKIMALLVIHSVGLLAIGAILQMVWGKTLVTSMGLILLETFGVGNVLRRIIAPQYMMFTWGMRNCERSMYGEGGYGIWWVIVLQIGLFLLVSIPFGKLKKRVLTKKIEV